MTGEDAVSVSVFVQPIQKSGYLTLTFPRSSPLSSTDLKSFEATESSYSFSDDASGTSIVVRFPDENYAIVPESFRRVKAFWAEGRSSESFRFNLTGSQFAEVLDYEEATKDTDAAAAARQGPVGGEGNILRIKCRTCQGLIWDRDASSSSQHPACGRVTEIPMLAPEWRAAGSFFCHHSPGGSGGSDEVQPRIGEFVVFPFRLRTNCEKDLMVDTDGGDGAVCPQCRSLVGMGQDLFIDALSVELDLEENKDGGQPLTSLGTAFDRLAWAIAKAIPGRVQPLSAVLLSVDKSDVTEDEVNGPAQNILSVQVVPGRLMHFQETRPVPVGSTEFVNVEFTAGFRLFWRKGTVDDEARDGPLFAGPAPLVALGQRGFDEVLAELTEMAHIQGSEIGVKTPSLISVSL